ncbi:DUF4238 domain-containing protein [Streptomyces californicus]|uniref:DUF4238 domain-containing protein n=1 Tax=Streptomyces californicus TaxID=67351 RepID=UPI00381EB66A
MAQADRNRPSLPVRRCKGGGVRANTSREHHLVPKYWLRAFAEDGHVLGRWRSGAEHRTPMRRAAVGRDFNTDPLAEGERRVALETYLDHHVDAPCAPVLRVVARDGGHWTRRSTLSYWTRWPGRWCARRRSGPSTSRSASNSSQHCGLRRQWVSARNSWSGRCRTRSGWRCSGRPYAQPLALR